MLRSNRLAQGLPISTIILAVLGVLVLIIVGAMIAQRAGWFGKETRAVTEKKCEPNNVVRPIGTDCTVIFGSFSDVGSGELCCKKGTVR